MSQVSRIALRRCSQNVFVIVFVFVFVFVLVRSYLLISLIKCLKGHKSPGLGPGQLSIDPDFTQSVARMDKKFTDWKIYIVSCVVRLE